MPSLIPNSVEQLVAAINAVSLTCLSRGYRLSRVEAHARTLSGCYFRWRIWQ